MAGLYIKYASRLGLTCAFELSELGHVILKVVGNNVEEAFKNESGKHVVQRVPDTERHGRKHTSIVSVAILPLPQVKNTKLIPEKELDIKAQCGSGAGGQKINRTHSFIRMKHIPTNISVYIGNERSQNQNKNLAHRILSAKVNDFINQKIDLDYSKNRKEQVGDGKRGDKTRTYNFCESRVVDHRLGTKCNNIKEIMKGNLELIYENNEEKLE